MSEKVNGGQETGMEEVTKRERAKTKSERRVVFALYDDKDRNIFRSIVMQVKVWRIVKET